MKNNLTYKEAVHKVKIATSVMKVLKRALKRAHTKKDQRLAQDLIRRQKLKLNLLLSTIHAHKNARKLYYQNIKLSRELSKVTQALRDSNIKL